MNTQSYFFSLSEFQYRDLLTVFENESALCNKIADNIRGLSPEWALDFENDATRLAELYNLLQDAGNKNFTQYFFKFDLDDASSKLLCNTLTGAELTADAAAKALAEDGKHIDANRQALKAEHLHDLNVILGTRRRNHG